MRYNPATAAGQREMCQNADRRVLETCKAFNEIMTGPNPLTPDEVRKLIDKRPDRYGCLEAWATPPKEG